MVEKISLNVFVTPLNTEHNFLIPADMNVATATALVVKAVCDEYPQIGTASAESNMLVQASTGRVLNKANSLRQLGIVPGEKLILL